MKRLDACYRRLLEAGFLVVREAVHAGQAEWAEAEIEMLHNLPGLIGESNVQRHAYYWFTERQAYREWTAAAEQTHAKSRMETFYEPIWREMEPMLLELFETAEVEAGR